MRLNTQSRVESNNSDVEQINHIAREDYCSLLVATDLSIDK